MINIVTDNPIGGKCDECGKDKEIQLNLEPPPSRFYYPRVLLCKDCALPFANRFLCTVQQIEEGRIVIDRNLPHPKPQEC